MDSAKPFTSESSMVDETPIAVATIIRVRGSVPREVGTKSYSSLGQHYGTFGGAA